MIVVIVKVQIYLPVIHMLYSNTHYVLENDWKSVANSKWRYIFIVIYLPRTNVVEPVACGKLAFL